MARWKDDLAGALATLTLIGAIVVALLGLSWLRVQWCVALGGDETTCAAAATISGGRR